jgi:tight adherence protein B
VTVSRRVRGGIALAGIACILAFLAPAAQADNSVQVHIRDTAIDTTGTVTLTVQVGGAALQNNLTASNFSVLQGNQAVTGLNVQPLQISQAQPVALVILIDDSGSMVGAPHANSLAAASTLIDSLPPQVQVGLVAISNTAQVVSPITTDRVALHAAIAALPVGGETAIFDAISLASTMLSQVPGQHNILLFTDGGDTVSKTTLAGALAAAKAVKAPIDTVGLTTPDSKPAVLSALASGTGGSLVSVSSSGQLASAFKQVAQSVASQYLITYRSPATGASGPTAVNLTVNLSLGSATALDTATVLFPQTVHPTPSASAASVALQPAVIAHPPLVFLSSPLGLVVGVTSAFVAVACLVFMLLYRPHNEALAAMRRGQTVSVRPGGSPGPVATAAGAVPESSLGALATSVSRKAVGWVDKMPKPPGFEERLQALIDHAGWPMRASEFLALQAVSAIMAGLIGIGLLGNWLIAALMFAVGLMAPRLVLNRRARQREAEFLEQLPDTLQLLSASLRAGASLLQAIDTVTKEASPPTSTEFARVITEGRLGRPIEEALEAMATRVGGEDFRWVVMAINIQRQVGGNLAAVLETVANTLRERAALRRQVKVLTAEGRLSGIILFVLPILLAGYLALVNPSYIGTLFSSWVGEGLIVVALVLMAVGGLWMRKLIRIKI